MPHPYILIVSGLGNVPAHFEPLRDHLSKRGFKSSCPILPSCSPSRHAGLGLSADSTRIRIEIEDLLDNEHEVIVVAHSFGGIIASQAIQPGHSYKTRAIRGEKGGLIQILFLTALLPLPGQSFLELAVGAFPPWFMDPDVRESFMSKESSI